MDILLNPNIAYILLTSGLIMAFLAVLTPGTGIFEVGALTALILAGVQIYSMEVNLWALILILAAVAPFVMAVRQKESGIYLAVSIVLLLVGSALLFRGEGWQLAVNPLVILVVSLVEGGFLWVAAQKTLESARTPPVQNLEALIGARGETKTDVYQEGSVYIAGELWSAYSQQPIEAGTPIFVVGREGFILRVEPLPAARKADE